MGFRDADGITYRDFTLFAKELFKGRSDLVGVEIGAYKGGNAESLRLALNPKLLILIDIWEYRGEDELYEQCMLESYRMSKFHKEVILIKCDSFEAAKLLSVEFDFVYVDGNHNLADSRDIEAWYPKVKRGGLFGGHDYNMEGVHVSVDKAFGNKITIGSGTQGIDWWIIK